MDRVIVQTLSTQWTKQSRGAPSANRRNATPAHVVLDPTRVLDGQATWHEVAFHEPDFAMRETYLGRSLPNDFLRLSVFLEAGGDTLSVSFSGSVRLRLSREQLGRIVYNLAEDAPVDGWYETTFHQVSQESRSGLTGSRVVS